MYLDRGAISKLLNTEATNIRSARREKDLIHVKLWNTKDPAIVNFQEYENLYAELLRDPHVVIGDIEKETWEPILDILYEQPTLKEKHDEFVVFLKDLDKALDKYKSQGRSVIYSPRETTFEKIIKHLDRYPDDLLGHKRFLVVVERMKSISSDKFFRDLLKQADANMLAEERLSLYADKASSLKADLLEDLFQYLDTYPIEKIRQSTFLKCVSKIMFLGVNNRSAIYDKSLQILENNPDVSSVKQFVLLVGRWHFSKSRVYGKVSIYDEQRIQNDILVRTRV
jgi:hypothetical protein